jgi:hypothetical protein
MSASKAFQSSNRDAEKVFYLNPSSYFNFAGMNNTLAFVIAGDSLAYSTEL